VANFDSGVKSYIKAYAVVEVGFPVDWKDNPDVCCYQCKFFSRNTGMCQLTKEMSEFPQKYVGSHCPLEIKE
jgi:hypothetical protein